MKKFMTFAFALACAICANAQNELQVVPASVEAGKEVYVLVNLNSTETANKVQNMELFIQWPEGWTIGAPGLTHKDVRNRTAEYDEDEEGYVAILTGGAQNQGNNLIKYVYYAKDSDQPLKGGSGAIFRIKVTVPAGTPDGYYPITLTGGETSFIATSGAAGSEIWLGTQTSYIKVGTPSNANLALEGKVPAFVNEALAAETGIAKLDLSAVTAVNGEFTYVDGRAVVGTSATADVKYVGNKANYYSVNVPFTGTATGEFYELKSVDENFAVFSTATTVKAGETYLAKGEVTLTANAAVATIENKENQNGSYVYEGMFYTGKNLTVPATRGLFDVPAGSNLRVVIDGELTGITTAEIDAQAGNTYDLQGRQSVNAKNGVFVVNGKKQFVK